MASPGLQLANVLKCICNFNSSAFLRFLSISTRSPFCLRNFVRSQFPNKKNAIKNPNAHSSQWHDPAQGNRFSVSDLFICFSSLISVVYQLNCKRFPWIMSFDGRDRGKLKSEHFSFLFFSALKLSQWRMMIFNYIVRLSSLITNLPSHALISFLEKSSPLERA